MPRYDWTEFDTWFLNLEGRPPRGSLTEYSKRTGIRHNTISEHIKHLRWRQEAGDLPAPPVPGRATPYPLLNNLLARLPADGQWTQDERDRWLAAFTACLDVAITIS